jgi:type I restriction enzyme S subunit
MSFPRYGNYRDSGVEWLGEVPEGWEIRPVKAAFEVIGGTTPKSDVTEYWDGEITWVTPADLSNLPSRFIFDSARQITKAGLDSCGTTIVPKGSVVLSVRAPIGSLAIAGREVCTNQGCKALVPKRTSNPDFFYFVLEAAREALNTLGRGSTFLELSGDQLAAFRVPLPPLPEQTAIAAFLDRETAKIDALVAEQRRLIDLLKEKRQAVISHAVTKGLNPNAPLKTSGIDWLGDVPEGWEVGPLKRFWSVTDCKHLTADFVEDGFPLASIREVQSRFIDLSEAKRTTAEYYNQLIEGGRKPFPGDLIFSRNATVGQVSQVSESHPPFAMGQDVCLLRKMDKEYAADYMQAFFDSFFAEKQLDVLMIGATFKRVNVDAIRNLIVVCPTASEQGQIGKHIQIKSGEFDSLTDTAETAIAILQERRAALISAAVTGKIDVRHLSPEVTEPA